VQYKPGQKVPRSGIYKVNHDGRRHLDSHEVTAVKGEPFPPCQCGQGLTYSLVRAARHLNEHPSLKYGRRVVAKAKTRSMKGSAKKK